MPYFDVFKQACHLFCSLLCDHFNTLKVIATLDIVIEEEDLGACMNSLYFHHQSRLNAPNKINSAVPAQKTPWKGCIWDWTSLFLCNI